MLIKSSASNIEHNIKHEMRSTHRNEIQKLKNDHLFVFHHENEVKIFSRIKVAIQVEYSPVKLPASTIG